VSTFDLVPLGVGDAFSARFYSSCLLLEAEGCRLLIDCPHPIRKMLREAASALGTSFDSADVQAVLLTHLHADHASGLEGYGYFSHFVLRRRARIYAHPSVSARLWDGHLAAGMECLLAPEHSESAPRRFEDYFELSPLSFETATRIGPFSVECRATLHHIPTTAFRIRAGGRSLGYSADTAFDPSLIEWLSAADLVIHETNYGIHTPYAKLAALPAELRARMRLIHYPDELDVDASAIEALRQGVRYTV
jgi:ribonuclease BN (tRNA processing enzyme)